MDTVSFSEYLDSLVVETARMGHSYSDLPLEDTESDEVPSPLCVTAVEELASIIL